LTTHLNQLNKQLKEHSLEVQLNNGDKSELS